MYDVVHSFFLGQGLEAYTLWTNLILDLFLCDLGVKNLGFYVFKGFNDSNTNKNQRLCDRSYIWLVKLIYYVPLQETFAFSALETHSQATVSKY